MSNFLPERSFVKDDEALLTLRGKKAFTKIKKCSVQGTLDWILGQ